MCGVWYEPVCDVWCVKLMGGGGVYKCMSVCIGYPCGRVLGSEGAALLQSCAGTRPVGGLGYSLSPGEPGKEAMAQQH